VLVFQYEEWHINDNYTYEHLFGKSNILGLKEEHSEHVINGIHFFECIFQKSCTVLILNILEDFMLSACHCILRCLVSVLLCILGKILG
jgi:hypothetical protein